MQRFYGAGSPLEWLQLPEPALIAFIEMKPVIEAQESMQRGNEVAYGMARAYGANDLANGIWDAWQRIANAIPAEPEPERTARDDRNAFLTMMRGSGLQRR